jgi:hypothetical protein
MLSTPDSQPHAPTLVHFIFLPFPLPRRFWCLLIVAAYIIFFRVVGILALRYIMFLKR